MIPDNPYSHTLEVRVWRSAKPAMLGGTTAQRALKTQTEAKQQKTRQTKRCKSWRLGSKKKRPPKNKKRIGRGSGRTKWSGWNTTIWVHCSCAVVASTRRDCENQKSDLAQCWLQGWLWIWMNPM
jgi:hypothetical protein